MTEYQHPLDPSLPMPYRIWNPEYHYYNYSGRTPSMLAGFFNCTAVYNTLYDIDYEVCSGKKDELGVDIYQNDILYVDFLEKLYKVVFTDTSYNRMYCLEAIGTDNKSYSFYGGLPEECVVVGSKYTLPELWNKFNN